MHVICPAAVNDTVLSTHSDHPYHRANVAPSSLEVSPSSAKLRSAPRLWYPSLCSPGLAGGPSRPDLQAQETEGGGDGCTSSNPWKIAPPSHLGSSEKNHQAGAETLWTFLENRNSVFRLAVPCRRAVKSGGGRGGSRQSLGPGTPRMDGSFVPSSPIIL